MIRDFIRNLGNVIFAIVAITAITAIAVAVGLGVVWLLHPSEGWDVFVFIVSAVAILVAAVMTVNERIG